MMTSVTSVWETESARQFARVVAAIDDVQVMQNFLRDIMTEKEIVEVSSRLAAAKMLQQGKKYTEIVEKTKLSSRTVARISGWMQNGCGGYAIALKPAAIHHAHTSPARAE